MKMTTIRLKALSVNDSWRGRRFKTQEYKDYEYGLSFLLPTFLKIPKGKLKLEILVGFSSKASDLDNILKPFIDVLQKKYKFNDNRIYKLKIEKEIILKGKEFIKFKIKRYGKKNGKIEWDF